MTRGDGVTRSLPLPVLTRSKHAALQSFLSLSEGKLQLVADHAAAAVRELGMEKLSRRRSKHVRWHTSTTRREWTHARRPVLRMIEDVIKLRPQLNRLCFPNMNSLQQVKVPVILSRRPQRIASEITPPPGARQQSNVLRARRIDTCTRRIRIRVEGSANRNTTGIGCGRCNRRYCTNSWLTIRIEVRSIEVSTNRIGVLSIHDRERHSGFKRRHT